MSDVHFSYLHGPRRHVCIARHVDHSRNMVAFGVSVCHPSDVFRKSLGREIAEGRMRVGHDLSWVLQLNGAKPLETIMGYLASGGKGPYASYTRNGQETSPVPTCVKELAIDWHRPKVIRCCRPDCR